MPTYGFFPSPESASRTISRVNKLWAWFTTRRSPGGLFVAEPPGVAFYNNSGETIPPHAVMQITSGNESIPKVVKPIDKYGAGGQYLINGEESVLAGKYGWTDGIATQLIKTNGGTIAHNKRLSATPGDWYASENPAGPWRAIGPAESLSYAGDYLIVDWAGYPPVIEFVAPLAGIAGATGTAPRTMSSATCNIWNDSATAGQTIDSGFTETIYNAFDAAVPGSARGYAALSGRGIWRAFEIPIVDLRLDGNDWQYLRGGTWTTWVTGSDCPEP